MQSNDIDNHVDAVQELTDLFADFVQDGTSKPALELLFEQNAGQWIEFQTLCHKVEKLRFGFEQVKLSFEGNVFVTWIDFPQCEYGDGYCVIVLFAEYLIFSTTAIYNKALLNEELIEEKKH